MLLLLSLSKNKCGFLKSFELIFLQFVIIVIENKRCDVVANNFRHNCTSYIHVRVCTLLLVSDACVVC